MRTRTTSTLLPLMALALAGAFCIALPATTNQSTVSLKLKGVPLRQALDSLSQQSGADLVYADDLVESVLVSCEFENLPAEKALTKALEHTAITFRRQGASQFILYLRPSIDLSGTVIDAESGETLPNANVSLAGGSQGSSTNTEGRFILRRVPVQPCTLQIGYIGYASQRIAIDPAKDALAHQVKLQPITLSLAGVTVQGQNWDIIKVSKQPSQVAVSSELFSALPMIVNKDVFRSLQLLPGIMSLNEGASGLYVRGGTPSQNLVLFDGMTIYHLDHSFGFLSAFNADAIKDVQVYKGGFPAKYGGRLSSVMDLTAKNGDFSRFRLSASASQTNLQSVAEVPLRGSGALLLSLRGTISDNVLNDLYNRLYNGFVADQRHRPADSGRGPVPLPQSSDTKISYYDAIAKATIAAGDRSVLSLSLYSGRDHLADSQTVALRSGGTFQRGETTQWGNGGLSGKWFREWQPSFHTTVAVAHSRYESSYELQQNAPDVFPGVPTDSVIALESGFSHNRVEDTALQLDNDWQANSAHLLQFGLAVSAKSVHYDSSIDDRFNYLRQDQNAVESVGYMQDAWQVSAALRSNAGIRITHYDATSKLYFEPRLSFTYEASRRLALKGAWGHYYQFINRVANDLSYRTARDFWVLADGRAIQPGFAQHFVVGGQYETAALLFDLELYHKNLEDYSEYPLRRNLLTRENMGSQPFQGKGKATGIEMLLQKKSGRFNGWLSYSFSRTIVDFPQLSRQVDYPADQDTPHSLNVVANYARAGWILSATWSFASGRPYTTPEMPGNGAALMQPTIRNSERLPPSHRLDASLSRLFSHRPFTGKIGLSVFNLYDRENLLYRDFAFINGEIVPIDVKMLGITPTLFAEIQF